MASKNLLDRKPSMMDESRQCWIKDNLQGPVRDVQQLTALIWSHYCETKGPHLVVILLDEYEKFISHQCVPLRNHTNLQKCAFSMLRAVTAQEHENEVVAVVTAHNLPKDKQTADAQDLAMAQQLDAGLQIIGVELRAHFASGATGVQLLFTAPPKPDEQEATDAKSTPRSRLVFHDYVLRSASHRDAQLTPSAAPAAESSAATAVAGSGCANSGSEIAAKSSSLEIVS
jgi:hypothetical protein